MISQATNDEPTSSVSLRSTLANRRDALDIRGGFDDREFRFEHVRSGGVAIALSFLAVFVILGLLSTLRRYAFPRHLVVDEEGVWLPSGFLHLNVRRVVFAEVSDVWEAFIPRTVALCLRSQGKTYEVVSTLLPDHETYLEVAGYISSAVVASGT